MEGINDYKRICLHKVKINNDLLVQVNGMQDYHFHDNAQSSLLKRGKHQHLVKQIILQELPLSHAISAEKKKDVQKLLSVTCGQNWQNLKNNDLSWYKKILFDIPTLSEDLEDDDIDYCKCLFNEMDI
jgi:hypothetical protein